MKGNEELARLIPGLTTRVLAIPRPELDQLDPQAIIARYLLGVRERNIRVIYLQIGTRALDPRPHDARLGDPAARARPARSAGDHRALSPRRPRAQHPRHLPSSDPARLGRTLALRVERRAGAPARDGIACLGLHARPSVADPRLPHPADDHRDRLARRPG